MAAPGRSPEDLLAKYAPLDKVNSASYCRGTPLGKLEKCTHSQLFSEGLLKGRGGRCPVKGCRRKREYHNKFCPDDEVEASLKLLETGMSEDVVQDILSLAKVSLVGDEPEVDEGFEEELSDLASIDNIWKDPLTLQEIEIPVRGPHCEHNRCFDLATYLGSYRTHFGGVCPICQEPAPACQLIFKKDYMELLRDARCRLQDRTSVPAEIVDLTSDMKHKFQTVMEKIVELKREVWKAQTALVAEKGKGADLEEKLARAAADVAAGGERAAASEAELGAERERAAAAERRAAASEADLGAERERAAAAERRAAASEAELGTERERAAAAERRAASAEERGRRPAARAVRGERTKAPLVSKVTTDKPGVLDLTMVEDEKVQPLSRLHAAFRYPGDDEGELVCFEDPGQWLYGPSIAAFLYRLQDEDTSFSSLDWDSVETHTQKLFKSLWRQTVQRDNRFIGYVVNTEPPGVAGHWVAILLDRSEGWIEYSDSMGSPPDERMEKLLKEIAEWLAKKDSRLQYKLRLTTRVFQTDGWACGFYALSYIKQRVQGVPFEQLNDGATPSQDVAEFRSREFPGGRYVVSIKDGEWSCVAVEDRKQKTSEQRVSQKVDIPLRIALKEGGKSAERSPKRPKSNEPSEPPPNARKEGGVPDLVVKEWLSEKTERTKSDKFVLLSGELFRRFTKDTGIEMHQNTFATSLDRCEAIFPPREQIDKESIMRGITNRAGHVLRDSIVPDSALLRDTGPFVLPPGASKGVPAPESKFRGSLRGETTSLDLSRIGPQWVVDGHNIQNPKCIMEEDNRFERAGLWTRNIYKDRASVKTCLH
ncbi:hypothetical protein KFL_005560060 [Klebsormidium nitens]|uniref:Uncharacterized protein n=1 Tax=Klebsormidium nitens TaxID=105231 RepID=A0A1Y1IMB0_KLENI|nr:hypothetical protein KFL_005560060 [Klebsormidium nitens]|eukprot:GAQ89727.1 hypothetical protein KFL_005560060 [Klebsormidium nitens]